MGVSLFFVLHRDIFGGLLLALSWLRSRACLIAFGTCAHILLELCKGGCVDGEQVELELLARAVLGRVSIREHNRDDAHLLLLSQLGDNYVSDFLLDSILCIVAMVIVITRAAALQVVLVARLLAALSRAIVVRVAVATLVPSLVRLLLALN